MKLFSYCFLVALLPFLVAQEVVQNGFVEEVACSSTSMTVMLNKSDPTVIRWMQNPLAQPVAYVYGHKARTPCGVALKGSQTSGAGLPAFNFTIPYGKACNVYLTHLEPNYQTAETTIALEDNNDSDDSKPMRINHVFCLYTRNVETLKTNDVSTGHEVVAITGGKPKPKIEMMFRNKDGLPIKAVKFGDVVSFFLALSPDNAYKAVVPKHCHFTDRANSHDPTAKRLTFVQSECPVKEMSEIIDPLNSINDEVYFTKFKTFRFGNQSTVYAHCTVRVCLTIEECQKACYHRVVNSTLNAERLRLRRFRHKRDLDGADDNADVEISSSLTVLDEEESVEVASGASIPFCFNAHLGRILYIASASLFLLLCIAFLVICALVNKLRSRQKQLEVQTLYPSPMGISGAPLSAYDGSVGGSVFTAGSRRSLVLDPYNNGTLLSIGGGSGAEMCVGPRPAWMEACDPQPHRIPRIR